METHVSAGRDARLQRGLTAAGYEPWQGASRERYGASGDVYEGSSSGDSEALRLGSCGSSHAICVLPLICPTGWATSDGLSRYAEAAEGMPLA